MTVSMLTQTLAMELIVGKQPSAFSTPQWQGFTMKASLTCASTRVASALAPGKWFAKAHADPTTFDFACIFATTDVGLLGRCASVVAFADGYLAVTIADDRLTAVGLRSALGAISRVCLSTDGEKFKTSSMKSHDVSKALPSIIASACGVASIGISERPYSLCSPFVHQSLIHGPAPTTCFGFNCATFAGGSLAVVALQDAQADRIEACYIYGDNDKQYIRQSAYSGMKEELNAIVCGLDPRISRTSMRLFFTSRFFAGAASKAYAIDDQGIVSLVVHGTPISHIASTIFSTYDTLCRLASASTVVANGAMRFELEVLMTSAAPEAAEQERALCAKRHSAMQKVAEVVVRDEILRPLKAWLWRPEGRLARAMFDAC